MVSVLCADLTPDDMKPMVYTEWPNNGTIPNTTTWPDDFDLITGLPNKTNVDELFGFDEINVHPIFPKLPQQYNTVYNYSAVWNKGGVYVLANGTSGNYTLCSLRTALTPNCSTEYHATGSGGSLSTNCETKNDLAYIRSNSTATNGVWVPDWVNVVSLWGNGLSLNDGINDGQAANARLLTQLIPKTPKLDESLPSISEALAVLAGNTLLMSSLDSPFIHYWNYSTTVDTLAEPGQYQSFKGKFRTMIYQSGGTQNWQRMFHIVLLLVFLANICCWLYFLISGHLVTDFVEPQNLFCLSLLSPPSEALEGTCAGGPDKEHYDTRWNIKLDKARDHVWFEGRRNRKGIIHTHRHNWSGSTQGGEYEIQASPVARMYSKIRKKRSSML